MPTALRIQPPALLATVPALPSEPFPERITHGCETSAEALRSHADRARRDMDRREAEVERYASPDATPAQRARARSAALAYRQAAREHRAFVRLAELHERRQMPSPLFTVCTRRHVRALLGSDTYGPDEAAALKTATRWTLGLPMHRATGFAIMREGVERLGLLAPVLLPLAVAQVLPADEPPPSAPAPALALPIPHDEPALSAEAFIEVVTARAAEGWIGHVTQFAALDFTEAHALGLSVEHAVEAARDWITGAVVFGPLPFAWGAPDGTGRPFRRDERGRLRPASPPSADPPAAEGAPDPAPGPTDGGGESPPALRPTPTERDLARADTLDAQAATAEKKADAQRTLYAGMNLTRRRARHRAAGMKEAERLTVYARALRALAQAIRAGTCPPALAGVSTRAHVERLIGVPSGPDGRVTVPTFPREEPYPAEWQEQERQKSRRAFRRMGIETPEQFEAAVAALAALVDGHADPDAEARQRSAEVERLVEAARLAGIPDYFRTPPALAARIVQEAGLPGPGAGVRVLEPSAGDGALLDVLRERHPEARVDAVEPSHRLCEILRAKGHPEPFGRRFEHFEPSAPYDAIVMNPPFGRGGALAMDHVERAAAMLAPGGRLVAVVPESCHFRSDRRHVAFRAFVDDHGGYWIDLPPDTFRPSGTAVKTRLVVLHR